MLCVSVVEDCYDLSGTDRTLVAYGATQCPVLTERMALPEGKQDPRKDAQGEEVEEGEGKKGGFEQEGGLVI